MVMKRARCAPAAIARFVAAPSLGAALVLALVAGCSSTARQVVAAPTEAGTTVTSEPSAATVPTPTPTTQPTVKPTTKPKVKPKPTATLKKPTTSGADIPKTTVTAPADGVPANGGRTFTAAAGGTDVVGAGTTLVRYQVEVEDGITWGANKVWTPASFAADVDGILADPRGWIASSAAPITDVAQKVTDGSWSFQRVSGTEYDVRIRLATPGTVDWLCGQYGMDTQGVYSCRYKTTIVINLRRWLNGAPGFAMNLAGYHTMVINHEMGHRLGFKHMLCPGAGKPAPVMQEETINLAGCVPNAYPFAADGTFITGAWAAA